MFKLTAYCLGAMVAFAPRVAGAATVTIRSGNGSVGGRDSSVTFLSGPANTDFNSSFTQSDFANAQRGPAAFVIAPNPLWVPSLSADPSAKWIGTSSSSALGQGSTALYAISFTIPNAVSSGTLTLNYAVDDGLGTTQQGLYLNGTAVCGSLIATSNQFAQGHSLTCTGIGPLLQVGTNWLYFDDVNAAGPAGLIFSATITTVDVVVSPQPSVASLLPSAVPAGSGPVTLTIAGAGFVSTSAVTFNGATHPAIFVSGGQLSIVLTAADLAAPGSFPVVVTNPSPGGGTSQPSFFIVQPALTGVTSTNFGVPGMPLGVVSDGANIWVGVAGSGNVMKLRASDGSVLGTYHIAGQQSAGVFAFDGANIWAAGGSNPALAIKIRASDGAVLGSFPVGNLPVAGTFDGANVWVPNYLSSNITKIRASDGTILGTFPTGNTPSGAAFDGANIWVSNTEVSNSVTELRASDGQVMGAFPVGNAPYGVVFDGANIWVANGGSDNATKLRASDGTSLGTFPAGSSPLNVVFDGSNVWVTDYQGNAVTELRAADGVLLGAYPVGVHPNGMVFDGSSIWVANTGSNTVSKLTLTLAPLITPGAIGNAASYSPGSSVAPGSIATVKGSFPLASASVAPSGQPWPTNLAGLSMQFSGIPAPLYYASAAQVNLQVPWELAGRTQVPVTVTVGSQTSSPQTVNVAPFSPGLFSMNAQGSGQGAILDSQYRLVDSSNPASVGDVVQIYCTGLGAVTNQPATGTAASASPLSRTTAAPTVTIGGVSAPVLFSGLAPDNVGLYQVNAQVPAGIVTGPAVSLAVSVGGVASNTVTVAVQPFPNPQPTISGLSPASATAGTASVTLTISGAGFTTSSTVTFNGMLHPLSSVGANQITIDLNASDLASTGTFAVIVSNPPPGGGSSQPANFTVSAAPNPQPSIAGLSPSSATAGTPSLTLTIGGSGFIAASSVTFNGASHAASFVNSGQLTISLSASDLSTAGAFAVLVRNPSPGGGVSNSMTFSVLQPAPNGLNGNWSGAWGSWVVLSAYGPMSATLAEAGTALTGSVSLSSVCFPGGPLSGTVTGNAINATITISGIELAALSGTVQTGGNTIDGYYAVASGSCAGDYGVFTLTRSE